MSKNSPLTGVRDVLVGIAALDADEPAASIGYGLTLARAAGAHLTVQSASWHLAGDDAWLGAFDEGFVATENRRLDALAASAAERAAGDANQTGVVCTTETPQLTYPEIVLRLVQQARLFDLTVLDASRRISDIDLERAEKVLFGSGRPVVVVPPGVSTFSAQRVLVAWDGGTQAARAINDAMPFLRAAEAVEVACVVGMQDMADTVAGAEIGPHLARHGVNVTVNDLPAYGRVEDILRNQAGLFRADLVVMGAYQHSRLREMVFGGVTRSLLKDCPMPLFLSH